MVLRTCAHRADASSKSRQLENCFYVNTFPSSSNSSVWATPILQGAPRQPVHQVWEPAKNSKFSQKLQQSPCQRKKMVSWLTTFDQAACKSFQLELGCPYLGEDTAAPGEQTTSTILRTMPLPCAVSSPISHLGYITMPSHYVMGVEARRSMQAEWG